MLEIIMRFALPLFVASFLLPLRAQKPAPDCSQSQQSLPDAPSSVIPSPERPNSQTTSDATRAEKRNDEAWPRKASHGSETISMYQPEVETWKGDELHAYAALAVTSAVNRTTKYGVLWFTARTEVDKVNRQVTLDDFQIYGRSPSRDRLAMDDLLDLRSTARRIGATAERGSKRLPARPRKESVVDFSIPAL